MIPYDKTPFRQPTQNGGYNEDEDEMEDPYRNVRFWKIIDFFRWFYFTK